MSVAIYASRPGGNMLAPPVGEFGAGPDCRMGELWKCHRLGSACHALAPVWTLKDLAARLAARGEVGESWRVTVGGAEVFKVEVKP